MKKQHTQHLKDRATILQTHLKRRGFELARADALNLVSQLEGYRSFTAAHHGKTHNRPGVFSNALKKYRTLTDGYDEKQSVEDYVADAGQHCPGCGGMNVEDRHEASADHHYWEILLGCGDCDAEWWAIYHLDVREGFNLHSAQAEKAFEEEFCPHCNASSADLDYLSFTPGSRAYQPVRCRRCRGEWVDVYRLADAAWEQDALADFLK